MSDKKSPVRNKESSRGGIPHVKTSSSISSKASSPKSATSSKSSTSTTSSSSMTSSSSSSDDHSASGKAGKKRLYSGGVGGGSGTSSSSSTAKTEARTDEDDRKPQSKRKKTAVTVTTATPTTSTITSSQAKNVSSTTTTSSMSVTTSTSVPVTSGDSVSGTDATVSIADSANPGALGSPSGGKSGRMTVPLSERQQMAMLMQISKADTPTTGSDAINAGDVSSSPHTSSVFSPGLNSRRTPTTTAKRLNKRNEKGETQLHLACIKGDVRRVRKLVKAGADVNVKDFAGWAPLHEACNHGYVSIAKHLLKAGAEANARGLDDDTPLHDAAMNGHERLVKLLLRQGANPKQANTKGKTPLDATNAIKPNIKALLTCDDVSTLASSEDESVSDDGDPLTSDDDENSEAFDSSFAPISGSTPSGAHEKEGGDTEDGGVGSAGVADGGGGTAGKEETSSSGLPSMHSAVGASKKLRERKSGSESGDGKSVGSSPRFRHHKKSLTDSTTKTRVDSGNSTPDSTRNAQLQLLRAAAEAEYAFQSDDDEPGSSSGKEKSKTKTAKLGATVKGKPKVEVTSSLKKGSEASPAAEAAKSDSNDSDAWRVNVDKVIEKLAEEEVDASDGTKSSLVTSSSEGSKDLASSESKATTKTPMPQKKGTSPSNSSSTKLTTSSSATTTGVASTTPSSAVTSATTTTTSISDPSDNSADATPQPAGDRTIGAASSGNEASSNNGCGGSRGASPAGSSTDPKVPPLKIILHGNNVNSDVKTRVHESVHSAKQALPYVVVTASGENSDQRDSPSRENSNSSSGVDGAVSSSTPGGAGLDREATASPNLLKRDADKDGAKLRASSREKDVNGGVGGGGSAGAAAGVGETTSEGRRLTRRAAAAAATGSESNTGVADSSSAYLIEENGSNGEKIHPQHPRKRKLRVGRTGLSGSHAGSDNSNGPDPPKKLDKDGSKEMTLPSSGVAGGQLATGGGPGSTHSGNGADSSFVGHGATNQEVDVSSQDIQTTSIIPTIAVINTSAAVTVASTSGKEDTPVPATSCASERSTRPYKPRFNCIEKHLTIRKQVDERRLAQIEASNTVEYKLPPEYKDMMISKKNYILAGNHASKFSIPMLSPPQSVTGRMRELFIEQERERYQLRLRHHVEREKLVLAMEPEVMRCYAQAARQNVSQLPPLSACSVLKDQEIYNELTPAKGNSSNNENNGSANGGNGESKVDLKGRPRYNGRQLVSWKQDVVEKFEKTKEALILRHHHEAESLHAVQKMDWEFKTRECGLRPDLGLAGDHLNGGGGKYYAVDEVHVPMVHVSDDLELMPT